MHGFSVEVSSARAGRAHHVGFVSSLFTVLLFIAQCGHVLAKVFIVGHDQTTTFLPPRSQPQTWSCLQADRASAPNVVALVTTARLKRTSARMIQRDYEYRLGLDYVFRKFNTVVATATPDEGPWPLLESYPWDKLVYYNSSHISKGGRESDGIRALISSLWRDGPSVHPWLADNNTVIVKLSGRYQPVRDDLLCAIAAHPDYDVWGRTCGEVIESDAASSSMREVQIKPGDGFMLSFFFAMRWGHLQAMYSDSTDVHGIGRYHKSDGLDYGNAYLMEWALRHYVHYSRLRFYNMSQLSVLANIDDRDFLRLY